MLPRSSENPADGAEVDMVSLELRPHPRKVLKGRQVLKEHQRQPHL
jgi:hypothetical protein